MTSDDPIETAEPEPLRGICLNWVLSLAMQDRKRLMARLLAQSEQEGDGPKPDTG